MCQLLHYKLSSAEGFRISPPDRLTVISATRRLEPRVRTRGREPVKVQGSCDRESPGISRTAGGAAPGGTGPGLHVRSLITKRDLLLWLWV